MSPWGARALVCVSGTCRNTNAFASSLMTNTLLLYANLDLSKPPLSDRIMAQKDAKETTTASGRDFHHPYVPYPIQLEFMEELYTAIEDGCVAILESPTGRHQVHSASFNLSNEVSVTRNGKHSTFHSGEPMLTPKRLVKGKSLSLICGALTWLRDHRAKDLEEQLQMGETGMHIVFLKQYAYVFARR